MNLRFGAALARRWPLLLRLLALVLLLNLIHPAEPRATLQEPQVVVTTLPQLCVHTRLIDEVEEWKIQRSLILAREMGAATIVEFFPWAYFETAPGQYNWRQADRIMKHARNQGLRIIARTGLVPAWARAGSAGRARTTLNSLPRRAWSDYADFVASFAARYQDELQHVIVWNEPNLAFEWGHETVTPEDYVDLLRVVHDALRQASPGTLLLAAGPAPTLEPAGSPYGTNDLDWLEAGYSAGAAEWSVGLALHSYGMTYGALDPPASDQLNFRRVELQREILLRHGAADALLFLSETGWNDHPRYAHAVSPARRIRHTLDALDHAGQHWPWLEAVCLWALRYPAPANSWRDGYTLVTSDFLKKPLYHAVQDMALGRAQGDALWLPPPVAPA